MSSLSNFSTSEVCFTLGSVNVHKVAGPDRITGHVLRACGCGLYGHFKPVSSPVVPTMFKTASIVPVPKHSTVIVLNIFSPLALTPIIARFFRRLVLSHLKSCLPAKMHPHQFPYCNNRSTEDAISTVLHSPQTQLDYHNLYVSMLFIDIREAFNTVIPFQLISKPSHLGISTSLCTWNLDFLKDPSLLN